MSNCSNCYNGCTEIVSDKCVRYTGVDVPVLGIKSGDSLSFVEQSLINFITSLLDGSGIILNIDDEIICELVKKHLPECDDLTLPNIITALLKAICELEVRVKNLEDDFADLEGPYTIGCLTGVTSTSGTHAILQAAITKLCSVETALNALSINLNSNYVKLADLNTLIQNYLNSISATTQQSSKMVPYTVVEYYPPGNSLSNFDTSGKGIASLGWDKIYICNGQNGTPDKRGRVAVGAIQGVPGTAPIDAAVDPTLSSANPNYALNAKAGANAVTLAVSQIPSHTHTSTANSVVTDPTHGHNLESGFFAGSQGRGTGISASGTDAFNWENGKGNVVAKSATGITVNTSVSINTTGGGESHANIQPVLACYYIMYIP
jgi:microcystin-dependent protein